MSDQIVEAEKKNIAITEGDTMDYSQDQYKDDDNGVPQLHDMTGMQLDCQIRDRNGTIIRNWSSAGTSPSITISAHSWNIFDLTPFLLVATYDYDLQLTDGSKVLTIRRGKFKVQKQITK